MPVAPDDVDDAFVPRAAPGVETITFDGEDEVLLVDGAGTGLHRINPMASLVWACFDGSSTVEAIVADLADGLGLPIADVRRDVLELTRDLARRRLLDGIAVADDDRDTSADPMADPRFIGEPPSH